MADLTPFTESLPRGPLWNVLNTGLIPIRPRARLETRLNRNPKEMLEANTLLRTNFKNPEMMAQNISEPRALVVLMQLTSQRVGDAIRLEGGHRGIE